MSGPGIIPVVVLKKCESELSYRLAKPFDTCLKESYFPDCLKVSAVVPVFEKALQLKTTILSLLSVVGKVFEKLVNDRVFNRSGSTQAIALDISKAIDKVWHAGLGHKFKSNGFQSDIWSYFLFSQ